MEKESQPNQDLESEETEPMPNLPSGGNPGIRTEWNRENLHQKPQDWEKDSRSKTSSDDVRAAFSYATEASIEEIQHPVGPEQDQAGTPWMESASTPCGDIHAGMEVIGSDGVRIGVVEGTQKGVIIIHRHLLLELRIPVTSCNHIENEKLYVNVPHDVIDNRGWAS